MDIIIFFIIIIVLYLLAIMPRITNRPDYTPLLGWHYAHRGLHDNESVSPENSMSAFKKAIESGFGIELDVQLTKDKVPVVFHDETLDRVCGIRGNVRDYTYKELQEFRLFSSQERIPKLNQVLKTVDGKVPLIIELKMHTAATEVCWLADELLNGYRGVYCIESFHPAAVLWYKRHRPRVIRGQLSSNFKRETGISKPSYFIVRHLLSNFITKPDFIAYSHEYKSSLSRRICRGIYRCLSVAWTIRSQKQLDACINDFDLFIFEAFIPREALKDAKACSLSRSKT